jgi:tRNA U34 5-methylaminomethyl-2-thiouridine-forming methyltransferase MnmC
MNQKPQQPSIIQTKDGSTSLYSPRYNQHYHNPNGAVSESRHVFFDVPGTAKALETKNAINIFEIGFGSGLNLLLLLDYLRKTETKMGNLPRVTFTSVEAHPIKPDVADRLDFGNEEYLNQKKPVLIHIFKNLQPGLNTFSVSDSVEVNIFAGFFDEFLNQKTGNLKVDYIFHDAFSPAVNSELWTPDVFRFLKQISHENTVLSTYCAASQARAAMAVAEWKIARARGALGKREMTIASPSHKNLEPFKRVNEERLAERYRHGDFERNRDL